MPHTRTVTQRRHVALAAAVFALVAPVSALAASATQDGYGDNDPIIIKTPTPKPVAAASAVAPATSASLPFTGFEAGIAGFVGLALAGTGVFLRRAGRSA